MAILKDSLKVMAISFVVSLSVYLVLAQVSWTEPSATPPGGNVSAPLNIGSSGQSKSGGLILNTGGATNGLIVSSGNVGIGTTSPYQTLSVAGNLSLGNNRLVDLAAPIALTDAATKGYVDAAGGGSKAGAQTFTSNGTFTVPANTTLVYITMVGGGGGGGGYYNFSEGGGGGGAEAFYRFPVVVTAGENISVTVGAGGAGGTGSAGGSNGGNSSFGAYLIAKGGFGGFGYSTPKGGAGGGINGGNGGISSSNTGFRHGSSTVASFYGPGAGGGAGDGAISSLPGGKGGSVAGMAGGPSSSSGAGSGGASMFGTGAAAPNVSGVNGSGGAGASSSTGGSGGNGFVIVEWIGQ